MGAIAAARQLYKLHDQGGNRLPVLADVSFEVQENEFVCIMGPSGSGKTTLLHLLSGLDKPSGGTVELTGKDLASLGERERTLLRRDAVGYVFQFFNLLPNLTVLENVTLPLAIQGKQPSSAGEAPRELLEKLGLGEKLQSYPHQLSGGEMQRASIARALCGGQSLLLCDEPTGNLAQQAGLEVMQILRRLREEEGRSILLVTHNPRDAAFADRVLFLVDGALASDAELVGPNIDVHKVHETLEKLNI
jgi:putative ABC transport system ATP-binding protein